MARKYGRLVYTAQNLELAFLLPCHNFLSLSQATRSHEVQSHTQRTDTFHDVGTPIDISLHLLFFPGFLICFPHIGSYIL